MTLSCFKEEYHSRGLLVMVKAMQLIRTALICVEWIFDKDFGRHGQVSLDFGWFLCSRRGKKYSLGSTGLANKIFEWDGQITIGFN